MMTLTSTQLGQLVAQFFLAGAGTLSFAVLFACPKRTLPCCALVGAVGWFVYELAVLYGADAAAASLIAVIPLSLAARICAVLLKTPVTVFLLTGIFPLARASTTPPTTSSRARMPFRWPTASPPSRWPWRWLWASRWCWACPCPAATPGSGNRSLPPLCGSFAGAIIKSYLI